jgi:hypothetical protein
MIQTLLRLGCTGISPTLHLAAIPRIGRGSAVIKRTKQFKKNIAKLKAE